MKAKSFFYFILFIIAGLACHSNTITFTPTQTVESFNVNLQDRNGLRINYGEGSTFNFGFCVSIENANERSPNTITASIENVCLRKLVSEDKNVFNPSNSFFGQQVKLNLRMENPLIVSKNGREILPVLENENISVTVKQNGSITFIDKQKNVTWGSDYPGWVELFKGDVIEKISLINSNITQLKKEGSLYVIFKGLTGNKLKDDDFEMRVKLSLNEKQFDIEIENLKTSYLLSNVEYPAHILTVKSGVENGYVVAPNLQGIMIPSRYDAGFMRYGQNVWAAITDIDTRWTFESSGLIMPWFGASLNNSSVLAYVMTSSDCQLHLIGNAVVDSAGVTVNDRQGLTPGIRLSSESPVWLSSKQEFGYSRKLRLELVSDGYVGMAKKYKEYAIKSGRFVTLKEKIKQNPEFEKIIGAPDIKIYCYTNRINDPKLKAWSEPLLDGYSKVNTSFDQVATISKELKGMGVDKCMILLAGWNRLGYDHGHVDIWPPTEKAGGIDGLKRACEAVKKNGYLFALHDNYDDFYSDAPSYNENYIIEKNDGSLQLGGIWDGGLCHIICPSQRKGLLDRNMDLVQKSIPLNGYYFDVITSTPHYECYDERHKVTRKEDLGFRMELIDDIRKRGLVIGGEGHGEGDVLVDRIGDQRRPIVRSIGWMTEFRHGERSS